MSEDMEAYRQAAQDHINGIKAHEPPLRGTIPGLERPRKLDLDNFMHRLELHMTAGETQKLPIDILILESFLSGQTQREKEVTAAETAAHLRRLLAEVILPSDTFAERSPGAIESRTISSETIAKYHILSYRGIRCIHHLQDCASPPDNEGLVTIYVCLATFTDLEDPWTCHETSEEAARLLKRLRSSRKDTNLADLLPQILQDRIRPAFGKKSNRKLAQRGREAFDPLAASAATVDDGPESKPWKHHEMYIPTVLRWVLQQLSLDHHHGIVEASWPLIIPPILALIDDSSIVYKTKGCADLAVFLESVPSAVLERTGLGEVMENAVMPCLAYLPTLTKEADSRLLLEQAYPALVKLAGVRFSGEARRALRVEALNRIMRGGVLKGYAQAGEYVKVAEILVMQLTVLVEELGIDIVRHLEDVLQLLSGILVDPFGTAYTPLLVLSVRVLRKLIVTAWPRVPPHRGEILKALTMCWLRAEEDETDSADLENLRQDIIATTLTLTASLKGTTDVTGDYHSLVKSDGRLSTLLNGEQLMPTDRSGHTVLCGSP